MTDNKKIYILSDPSEGNTYRMKLTENAANFFWWLYQNNMLYNDDLCLMEENTSEPIDVDDDINRVYLSNH